MPNPVMALKEIALLCQRIILNEQSQQRRAGYSEFTRREYSVCAVMAPRSNSIFSESWRSKEKRINSLP